MTRSALTESIAKAHQGFFKRIHASVLAEPDPFLVQSVLRRMERLEGGANIEDLLALLISPSDVKQSLDFLERKKLVDWDHRNNRGWIAQDGKAYAHAPGSYGIHELRWENLSQEDALALLKSAEPHVELTYGKMIAIKSEQLKSFQKEADAVLKELEQRENKYMCETLNLPADSKVEFDIVRAHTVVPERDEHTNVRLNYQTIDDAFRQGFRYASAKLKLPAEIKEKTGSLATIEMHNQSINPKAKVNEYAAWTSQSITTNSGKFWELLLPIQRVGYQAVVTFFQKLQTVVQNKQVTYR